MSFNQPRVVHQTSFEIHRFTDKQAVDRIEAIAAEGSLALTKSVYYLIFADEAVENPGCAQSDEMKAFLTFDTVATSRMLFPFSNGLQIVIQRDWDSQAKRMQGHRDTLRIEPYQQGQRFTAPDFAKLVAIVRKHFDVADTKPYMEILDESTKKLYQSREADLQRLERMQEGFFRDMTTFTLDQQKNAAGFPTPTGDGIRNPPDDARKGARGSARAT